MTTRDIQATTAGVLFITATAATTLGLASNLLVLFQAIGMMSAR